MQNTKYAEEKDWIKVNADKQTIIPKSAHRSKAPCVCICKSSSKAVNAVAVSKTRRSDISDRVESAFKGPGFIRYSIKTEPSQPTRMHWIVADIFGGLMIDFFCSIDVSPITFFFFRDGPAVLSVVSVFVQHGNW